MPLEQARIRDPRGVLLFVLLALCLIACHSPRTWNDPKASSPTCNPWGPNTPVKATIPAGESAQNEQVATLLPPNTQGAIGCLVVAMNDDVTNKAPQEKSYLAFLTTTGKLLQWTGAAFANAPFQLEHIEGKGTFQFQFYGLQKPFANIANDGLAGALTAIASQKCAKLSQVAFTTCLAPQSPEPSCAFMLAFRPQERSGPKTTGPLPEIPNAVGTRITRQPDQSDSDCALYAWTPPRPEVLAEPQEEPPLELPPDPAPPTDAKEPAPEPEPEPSKEPGPEPQPEKTPDTTPGLCLSSCKYTLKHSISFMNPGHLATSLSGDKLSICEGGSGSLCRVYKQQTGGTRVAPVGVIRGAANTRTMWGRTPTTEKNLIVLLSNNQHLKITEDDGKSFWHQAKGINAGTVLKWAQQSNNGLFLFAFDQRGNFYKKEFANLNQEDTRQYAFSKIASRQIAAMAMAPKANAYARAYQSLQSIATLDIRTFGPSQSTINRFTGTDYTALAFEPIEGGLIMGRADGSLEWLGPSQIAGGKPLPFPTTNSPKGAVRELKFDKNGQVLLVTRGIQIAGPRSLQIWQRTGSGASSVPYTAWGHFPDRTAATPRNFEGLQVGFGSSCDSVWVLSGRSGQKSVASWQCME